MNREGVASALGRVVSGLYVATARVEGRPLGMLCSFVEQAGFEPPMISLAIGAGRPILSALDAEGFFGLHVLSKENNALLKAFARGDNPAAWAEMPLEENRFGIPQFKGAWAFLACKVTGKLRSGDHTLYLAEVLDGAAIAAGEPMVRVRANGFTY